MCHHPLVSYRSPCSTLDNKALRDENSLLAVGALICKLDMTCGEPIEAPKPIAGTFLDEDSSLSD